MFPIPFIIPIQSYPQYIKKEDLDWFINRAHKGARLINILLPAMVIFVQVIMAFFVLPKLGDVYASANRTAPSYSLYIVIVSIAIGLALIIYNFQANPLDEGAVEKLRQDKSDMISVKGPVIDRKLQLITVAYLIIGALALVASIILPIYNLTSSY